MSLFGRANLTVIGTFTEQQFADVNAVRRGLGLFELECREIVFIGRHIYVSRSKDGYSVDDMFMQIESALSSGSIVFANPKMTAMSNPQLAGMDMAIWCMIGRSSNARSASPVQSYFQ